MKEIPLQAKPQQRIETDVDGINYVIQLRTAQQMTLADVYADGVLLRGSCRCIPGKPIIPYKYMTKGGNFFWYSADGSYPYYENFTTTQFLYYLNDEEIENLGKE